MYDLFSLVVGFSITFLFILPEAFHVILNHHPIQSYPTKWNIITPSFVNNVLALAKVYDLDNQMFLYEFNNEGGEVKSCFLSSNHYILIIQ